MMKRKILALLIFFPTLLFGQINTDRVMLIGRNALYFEDYVLSIQYFNQVINAKPYLHYPYFFRALAKLNLDDFKGTEDDCTEVLKINPFFVPAYQLRGMARAQLGKYMQAVEDYEQALKYNPEDINVWHNISLCYINEENNELAERSLDELLRLSPKYTPAYLMKADVAIREKDTLEALAYVDKAVELDKYDANIWAARGMIHLMLEKYPEAEKDYDEATYLGGQDSYHYVNRALARFHQNNLRGAMSDYDLALSIDPQNFIGHYNRGLLRARVGDYNRALEDFDFVLNIDPDNLMATFNRGLLRSRTGDYAGAEMDYSKVLDVYPNFYPGYYYRAEARKILGDVRGYEEDELRMLRMQLEKPSSSKSKVDKTKAEETRKRSDKNMDNYRKLVVADKSEIARNYKSEYRGRIQNKNVQVKSEPYFVLSYYQRPSELRQAIHYHKAIDKLNAQNSLPYPLLITNREKSLNELEAKKHFELIDEHSTTISQDPRDVVARFARGLDFFLVQDTESAIEDFTAAIAVDSQFYLAYFMRSVAKLRQLEYERAENAAEGKKNTVLDYELVLSDLSTVIKIAPDFVYAYYNRARLYFEMKDFEAAVSDYNEAIKYNPEFAEAYFNRGLIKLFLGNNEEGIADLSKAGELGIADSYNIIKRFRKAN
mgnify:CR=1 FL=1